MPTDQAFEIAVEPRTGAGQCPLHGLYWARLHECPECAVERNLVELSAEQPSDRCRHGRAHSDLQWCPECYEETRRSQTCEAVRHINRLRPPPVEQHAPDPVNHPPHYTSHPSGIECITVARHMGFNLGNATKYIWRADLKHHDGGVEDLEKAAWYLSDEIAKRKQSHAS